jgi:hypothetical protein
MDDGTLYTVGELARRTGLPVRTIRFDSYSGVLPPTGLTVRDLDRRPSAFISAAVWAEECHVPLVTTSSLVGYADGSHQSNRSNGEICLRVGELVPLVVGAVRRGEPSREVSAEDHRPCAGSHIGGPGIVAGEC